MLFWNIRAQEPSEDTGLAMSNTSFRRWRQRPRKGQGPAKNGSVSHREKARFQIFSCGPSATSPGNGLPQVRLWTLGLRMVRTTLNHPVHRAVALCSLSCLQRPTVRPRMTQAPPQNQICLHSASPVSSQGARMLPGALEVAAGIRRPHPSARPPAPHS